MTGLFSVTSLKTILGRKFDDPLVQSFATAIQYKIVDVNGLPFIMLTYKQQDGMATPLIVRIVGSLLCSTSYFILL